MPALPLHAAGKYVAAAYIVVFLIVLIYVTIIAARVRRIERDLDTLSRSAREPDQPEAGDREREPVA